MLPPQAERVLVLEAGLGQADPASRREVAGTLRITVARVAALEHAGLVTLTAAAHRGGCSDPTPTGVTFAAHELSISTAVPLATVAAPSPLVAQPALAAAAPASSAPAARTSARRPRATSHRQTKTKQQPSMTVAQVKAPLLEKAAVGAGSSDGAVPWIAALALLAGAAAAAFNVPAVRRNGMRAAAALAGHRGGKRQSTTDGMGATPVPPAASAPSAPSFAPSSAWVPPSASSPPAPSAPPAEPTSPSAWTPPAGFAPPAPSAPPAASAQPSRWTAPPTPRAAATPEASGRTQVPPKPRAATRSSWVGAHRSSVAMLVATVGAMAQVLSRNRRASRRRH